MLRKVSKLLYDLTEYLESPYEINVIGQVKISDVEYLVGLPTLRILIHTLSQVRERVWKRPVQWEGRREHTSGWTFEKCWVTNP